jgi:hypothetical protein
MTNDDSEITNISCKSVNTLYFTRFCIFQNFADVNEGKFVFNIDVCLLYNCLPKLIGSLRI